jgi:hypothetical protein
MNKIIFDPETQSELSVFGTPIFMPLTFKEFTYYDHDRRKDVVVKELFIPCVIVEVSIQKDIVKTIVQGQKRRGTFKEQINTGDYVVSIKGILSNDDAKYPLDKADHLDSIIKASVSLEIEHTILNSLGINNLVIESGTPIANQQGKQNIQPFSLSCVSDLAIELKLKNEQSPKQTTSDPLPLLA